GSRGSAAAGFQHFSCRAPDRATHLQHLVLQVIPTVETALAESPEGREVFGHDGLANVRERQPRGKYRQPGKLLVLARDQLGKSLSGLCRVHDTVASVAQCVVHGPGRLWLEYARHHVVADVDPAPPRILDRNARQRRKLAMQVVDQAILVLLLWGILSRDRAATADLDTPVRQQPVVV